jgi:ankyrin repeat protein
MPPAGDNNNHTEQNGAMSKISDRQKPPARTGNGPLGIAQMCFLLLAVNLFPGCADSRVGLELQKAAEKGDVRFVKDLIDHGADVNWQNSDGTALHRAVLAGRVEVVRVLLENGARVDAPIEEDALSVFRKANLVAARNRTEPIFQAFGATALHFAVAKNDTDLATLLIAKGADVNAVLTLGPDWKHRYLRTPVQLARSTEMRALLEQHGASEKPFTRTRKNI